MTRASDNEFPSVLLDEQASAPTTPATGFWRVYAKSDGLYIVDDAGTETGPLSTGGGGGGDLTLIEEITLGADGTFTFDAIPASYRDLLIMGRVRGAAVADTATVRMRVGNTSVDTGANYRYGGYRRQAGAAAELEAASASFIYIAHCPGSNATAGFGGAIEIRIMDYLNTATNRAIIGTSAGYAVDTYWMTIGGEWENNADTIDIITLDDAGSNFASGSNLALYGVGS